MQVEEAGVSLPVSFRLPALHEAPEVGVGKVPLEDPKATNKAAPKGKR